MKVKWGLVRGGAGVGVLMAVTAALVRSEEEEAGGAEDACVGAGAAGDASADLGVQALWVQVMTQVMTPGATMPPPQLAALPITRPRTRVPPLGAHA